MTLQTNIVAGAATLVEVLRRRAVAHPDRLAVIFLSDGENESARLTYAELDRQARCIAGALRSMTRPGQRALLLYPPGLDFIAGFFGCLYAGVVAVPLCAPHPRRPDARLATVACDCAPAVLLSDTTTFDRCRTVLDSMPSLTGVARLACGDVVAGDSPSTVANTSPADLALLQYTSGSTSEPKGVCITHANIMANERMIQGMMGLGESDRFISWLPAHHDMGLIGDTIQPLFVGGSTVKMPPAAFLQHPRRWLAAITKYKGTTIGGPNFAYDLCVSRTSESDRRSYDLSSLRVTYCGSEPIHPRTLENFAKAFAVSGFDPNSLFPCYGLAEATLMVSGGPRLRGMATKQLSPSALDQHRYEPASEGEPNSSSLVSCGPLVSGCEVVIVDPERLTPASPGTIGEVWVKGANTAAQYWQKPEASNALLQARLPDGRMHFLRTGDLGFMDDGELFITGRLKDLIIIRGRNIYPQDVEHVARESHRGLQACAGAAFAVGDSGQESVVLVHEVARTATEAEIAECRSRVRVALAEQLELQISALVLVRWGTVPRTSSGKVRRKTTREMFLTGVLLDLGSLETA